MALEYSVGITGVLLLRGPIFGALRPAMPEQLRPTTPEKVLCGIGNEDLHASGDGVGAARPVLPGHRHVPARSGLPRTDRGQDAIYPGTTRDRDRAQPCASKFTNSMRLLYCVGTVVSCDSFGRRDMIPTIPLPAPASLGGSEHDDVGPIVLAIAVADALVMRPRAAGRGPARAPGQGGALRRVRLG